MSDEIWDEVNHQRKLKNEKHRTKNRKLFDKVARENNFIILKEYNNIINFTFDKKEYFFVEKTKKCRQQGKTVWFNFDNMNLVPYTVDFHNRKIAPDGLINTFEIFFDGACNPTNPGGHMGYGFIVKENNEYISHGSYYEEAKPENTNNVAEYKACLEALNSLIDYTQLNNIKDFTVVVLGDSKLVVEQMNNKWRINSGAYVEFAEKTKKFISDNFIKDRIYFKWIPREQNEEADELSVQELISRGIERKY